MKDFLKQRLDSIKAQIALLTEEQTQRTSELKELLSPEEMEEYFGKNPSTTEERSAAGVSLIDDIRYLYQTLMDQDDIGSASSLRRMLTDGLFGESLCNHLLSQPLVQVNTTEALYHLLNPCKYLKDNGGFVKAIRVYRMITGASLSDAKRYVDNL